MSITLSALQRQRRDTAANWTAEDPTLLAGEIGLESDTGYWKVGDGATAWTSLAYVPGLGAEIPVARLADGAARQLLQTDAAGTGVEWTDNVDVPGTLDVTGAGTFDGNVTIAGDLTVNGTTTTINTQDLLVEDKNIIIGNVTTPSDVTADGGGITLKGTIDKTINWVDATDAWTLSEHVDLGSGKEYRIAGTKVLDATSLGSAVVSSSLTSVGTIGTGTWQGTTVAPGYGGTGQTTYTGGQLLIGKTDGTLAKSTITAGTGVTITNGDGSITIDATGTGLPTSGGTLTGALGIIAGSVTAPGLFFSGDTNTGIYSPAADNFAITTAGEQRLLVNSLGNFTIGGANASNAVRFFDVSNTDTGSSAGTALRLISSDAAGTGTASLDITKYKTGDAYISNSEASGSIIISVGTETARFTSSGFLLDNQSDLRFGEATGHGGNWVAFQAPATIASNVTWTLPDADGTTGQILSTNGSGVLAWADDTGAIIVDGGNFANGSSTVTTAATFDGGSFT